MFCALEDVQTMELTLVQSTQTDLQIHNLYESWNLVNSNIKIIVLQIKQYWKFSLMSKRHLVKKKNSNFICLTKFDVSRLPPHISYLPESGNGPKPRWAFPNYFYSFCKGRNIIRFRWFMRVFLLGKIEEWLRGEIQWEKTMKKDVKTHNFIDLLRWTYFLLLVLACYLDRWWK